MFFEMKNNIVITGASGFIGRHLITELSPYYSIFCLPFSNFSQDFIDTFPEITIIKSLSDIPKIHAVIHLAARVHQMKDKSSRKLENDYFHSNVEYPVSIAIEANKKEVNSFIFLSSVKIYGEKPGFYNENDIPMPNDIYGKSKISAEKKLISIFNSSNTNLTILRVPLVYGPHNKGNMLSLLKFSKQNIPLPIGSAHQKRSFLFVKNLTQAIYTIISSTQNSNMIFNLTDDNDISVHSLYTLICSTKQKYHFRVFHISRPLIKLITYIFPFIKPIYNRIFEEYRFSMDSFKKTFKWTPPFSIKDGIHETSKWYYNK